MQNDNFPNGVPELVMAGRKGVVVRDGDLITKAGDVVSTQKQLRASDPTNPFYIPNRKLSVSPHMSIGDIYGVFGPDNQLFYVGFTTQGIQKRRAQHLHNCVDNQRTWNERSPSPFPLLLEMLRTQSTVELLEFRQIGEGDKIEECRLIEENRKLGQPILNIGDPCGEIGLTECLHGGGCCRCGINTDETWSIGCSGWAVKPVDRIRTHFKWARFRSRPPSSGQIRQDSSIRLPRNLFVFSKCPVKPSPIAPTLHCWNHLLEKTPIDLDEYGKYDYAVDEEGQIAPTEMVAQYPEGNCSRWWWRQEYTGHSHPINFKQKSREGCFLLEIPCGKNFARLIWAIPDTPSTLKVNICSVLKRGKDTAILNPNSSFLVWLKPDYTTYFVSHRLEETSFTIPNEDLRSITEQMSGW